MHARVWPLHVLCARSIDHSLHPSLSVELHMRSITACIVPMKLGLILAAALLHCGPGCLQYSVTANLNARGAVESYHNIMFHLLSRSFQKKADKQAAIQEYQVVSDTVHDGTVRGMGQGCGLQVMLVCILLCAVGN